MEKLKELYLPRNFCKFLENCDQSILSISVVVPNYRIINMGNVGVEVKPFPLFYVPFTSYCFSVSLGKMAFKNTVVLEMEKMLLNDMFFCSNNVFSCSKDEFYQFESGLVIVIRIFSTWTRRCVMFYYWVKR